MSTKSMRRRGRWTPVSRLVLATVAGLFVAPQTIRAESCPAPPPAVVDLDIPRFYADARGSIVDPKQIALHDGAVAPLTAFLRHVTSDADKAWMRASDKSRAEIARCALGWMTAWAHGNAWLGQIGRAHV